MPKMAFGINGVGEESGFDNTPVKPGTYKGVVKNVRVTFIKKDGPNKGKPRLNIGCQVESGPDPKAKGRMFWTGLNVFEEQAGWVNGFLNAITDGSAANKKHIQEAFWGDGPDLKPGDDKHVNKIGKYKIDSPEGEIPITFTIKNGKDQDGEKRSEIGRFIVKKASDDLSDDDEGEDEPELASVAAGGSDDEDDEPPF